MSLNPLIPINTEQFAEAIAELRADRWKIIAMRKATDARTDEWNGWTYLIPTSEVPKFRRMRNAGKALSLLSALPAGEVVYAKLAGRR